MGKEISVKQLEKVINLMKYCHNPRTNKEIAEFLGYDDGDYLRHRSEISDLFKNNKKYEFLNVKFPFGMLKVKSDDHLKRRMAVDRDSSNMIIEGEDRNIANEVCTVNPIFLALNATEVSLLTSRLLDLVNEQGDFELLDTYKSVVSKIVSQLSDYTVDRISLNYPEKDIAEHYDLYVNKDQEYESENTYEGSSLYDIDGLDFFIKSQEYKEFILNNKRVKGRIYHDSCYYTIINSVRYDIEVTHNIDNRSYKLHKHTM